MVFFIILRDSTWNAFSMVPMTLAWKELAQDWQQFWRGQYN